MSAPAWKVLVASGAALIVGGAGLGLTAAGAAATTIVAADPVSMSITASQAVIPGGASSAVVLVDHDDEVLQVVAGSVAAGLPGYVPLLLADPEALDAVTLGELDRVSAGQPVRVAYLVGSFADAVVTRLEADGWAVTRVAGATALDTALALHAQTYGAPVGTSQRVLVVSDRPQDVLASSMAAVFGANVGIPVLPVGAVTPAVATQTREVIVVADPAVVPDDRLTGFAGAPADGAPFGAVAGNAVVTRIWDADPVALAAALSARLLAEPGEGLPRGWLEPMPVIVEVADAAVAPVAAMVAARRSLDGHPAALSVSLADFAVPGATHLDLLGSGQVAPAAPGLPATGGAGVVVASGVALVGGGLALRRRPAAS